LQGIRPEEAEDLTQGFFALILERRDLDTVRKEKGGFVSYLLTSLKYFLANEQRDAMRSTRGIARDSQKSFRRMRQGRAFAKDQVQAPL
jgi:hypothetical protein